MCIGDLIRNHKDDFCCQRQATRSYFYWCPAAEPLQPGQRIRLAHLQPSPNHEDQPVCVLHVVSVDENPLYEALSYVWGDPNITAPIQLHKPSQETQKDEISLPALPLAIGAERLVTTNLVVALRHLRYINAVRILWVDAICINQSNIEERNHQVSLMRNIYVNATAVQLWIGSSCTGSHEAMELLKQLGRGIMLEDVKIGDRCVEDFHLKTVIEILNRLYWTRTWIQQELVLSKRAIINCGFTSIEWADIEFDVLYRSVAKGYEISRLNRNILHEFYDSVNILWRISTIALFDKPQGGATHANSIRNLAMTRQCFNSDERDSVYGFLGLLNDDIRGRIRSDYTKTTAEVFRDTACQLVLCSSSLIVLSLTQRTEGNALGLPSWVPSWQRIAASKSEEWIRRTERLFQHDSFNACGDKYIRLEILNEQVLKFSGSQLDSVSRLGSVKGGRHAGRSELLAQDRYWRQLCGLDPPGQGKYISGGEAIDAYWRTLLNDAFRCEDFDSRRRCQSQDQDAYREWLYELEHRPKSGNWKSQLANAFHRSFSEVSGHRQFFITKKGYFGIGSPRLKDGDLIYILAGGHLPLILRPVAESKPDHFELIGDCYVHGVMDGEAMLERRSTRSPLKEALRFGKSFIGSKDRFLTLTYRCDTFTMFL